MKFYDINGNELIVESVSGDEYKNPNLVDVSNMKDTSHSASNPMYTEFGSATKNFDARIDVSEKKDVFVKSVQTTSVTPKVKVACYDENGNYLYTLNYTDGYDYTPVLMNSLLSYESDVFNGCIYIQKYTFAEEVKGVIFSLGFSSYIHSNGKYNIYSYENMTDMFSLAEEYPANPPKAMVMIGDSLTNWAGGTDYSGGFLTIVHDKANVNTKNEGLAGAWWQLMDGETIDDVGTNGVGRVNAIIADNRKYDVYCFMLGTNAGSATDTGETSADATTMCGAIRYCMEKLKAYDPTGKILVCLPPQRAEGNENQEKVNDVIKTIVESYGVKTLDIYHHSGIVPNTKIADVNYLSDGLHLGENGYTVLGNLLSAEVKYLLCL